MGKLNTVDNLLKTYRNELKSSTHSPEQVEMTGVPGFDVYNISAPFQSDNNQYIAGRVEKRDSEHSKVYFFKETESVWKKDDTTPVLELQDPFVTLIDGQLVIGGVEIFESEEEPSVLKWRTVFYEGETLNRLERFFEGPMGMKDLRLKQIHDGRILVMTRPQGNPGGRGMIGAVIIDSLNELSTEIIESAKLFEDMCPSEEWVGANEIHLLDKDTVGVLGHIAKFDESGDRHYYSMTFTLDINNLEIDNLKIIAERNDFLDGPYKRSDLKDVIFSGGLVRRGKEAILYAGISDAESQKVTLADPFI